MNNTIMKLYNERNWQEFISLSGQFLKSLNVDEANGLNFYIASAKMRLGQIDEALCLFRGILENVASTRDHQANSCVNMGVISHIKGDFEFSCACSLEYQNIIGMNNLFAKAWVRVETNISKDEVSSDKTIEVIRSCSSDKERRFIQNAHVMYWTKKGNLAECSRLYEMLNREETQLSSNICISAFQLYFEKRDRESAKGAFDYLTGRFGSEATDVALDYMCLCMKKMEGGEAGEMLLLANSVLKKISARSIFNSSAMLRVCGDILKSNETRNRILVPARFGMIGISPVMSALRDRIERFARSTSPVLIQGESGTGKELAAQALHDVGDRAAAPFIPVNCAAIPESVFESQLFGHVAGAFTGASKDQPGLIELAGDGTLFLDEVGELPLGVQAKLLRFLENGEFRRLGSEQVRRSRARILAATNRSLLEVEGFRQDLVHRLRRLELHMPPLRERREDIRYLARHRVRQLNLQDGSGWKQLEEAAEQALETLDYPGNVRELFNLVDHAWHEALQLMGSEEVERARRRMEAERARAAALGGEVPVSFVASPAWSLDFTSDITPLRLIQEKAACEAIRQALEHFSGDVDAAAHFLDVSRRSIYRYLEREREVT